MAFSCEGRGICPACGACRMAVTAAHLVDRELPHVPVRQWVFTLPIPLRYPAAFDHELCRKLRHLFTDTILRWIETTVRRVRNGSSQVRAT